jgi:hypothetical protein
MESTQASSQEEPPVPLNFKTIREIDDLPNEKIRGGCLVNVIGFIKDFQKPKQSRGTGIYPLKTHSKVISVG